MNEQNLNTGNCINDALFELKKLQDFLVETSTPFLGKILGRLVGVDTIPFMLLTDTGVFELSGIVYNDMTDKKDYFTTSFFKVNSIEKRVQMCRANFASSFKC